MVFLMAFLQMGFISSQMFHIAHANYKGAFFSSVLISCCWLFNVNAAIKPGWKDKVLYITGAALGTVASIYVNVWAYK